MLADRERALRFAQAPNELRDETSLYLCTNNIFFFEIFAFRRSLVARSQCPTVIFTTKKAPIHGRFFVVEMTGIEPVSDADLRGLLQV